MALVDAIAGIIFLTTPWVSEYVTPGILNSSARFFAVWKSQVICSGSSPSTGRSGKLLGHSNTDAHSMQCSGNRGVFAIVQMGYVTAFVCISNEHSKQEVIRGKMTLACPLKPMEYAWDEKSYLLYHRQSWVWAFLGVLHRTCLQ